jgi:hypothetical protein
MKNYKHSAAIPRRLYWSSELDDPACCPECKRLLEPEFHSYMIAIRHKRNIEPFVTGNDGGWFCGNCPIVVLDHGCFSEAAAIWARTGKDVQFLALGIVNLEAVPQDKRSIPFDDDTNPIPLVEFTNLR